MSTGNSRNGHAGMITIDPKSLWRILLTTLLTLMMGLVGWLASLAWDQQVANTYRIEQLEKQILIQEERTTELRKSFDEQKRVMWNRIATLESKTARLQAPTIPRAGK